MSTKGKIVTVTGEIDPLSVGVTMTHEHLYVDAPSFYIPPNKKDEKMIHAPFEMKNLGWIRQNPFCHKPNLTLVGEEQSVTEELQMYKECGGHSIVENSSIGLHRNLQSLKQFSESTGVNIIAGTGFYCENYQKEAVKHYSEEEMAEVIRSDLTDGEGGVKCGLIGEIGSSWPISDFEKRSLRSAGAMQSVFGCPVMLHPGRDPMSPAESMRILLEAGGKADRTVMAHLDRTLIDTSSLLEFADMGTFLEYDLFGIEVSYYPLNDAVDMPSDGQRINAIINLLDNGLEDRIVVSHDIYTKHRLVKYGGHGYSHILMNVIPKMLKRRVTQEQVDKILQHNPQKWLTFQ